MTSSAPGAVLAGKLLELGAAATRTDARVSRSAINFWSREDYERLLSSDLAWHPDVVIVMLGTNDLHLNVERDAQAMAGIRDVFMQAGAEVLAIGPPVLPESSDHVYTTLHRVFGGRVIDGRLLSYDAPRAKDGVHFTAIGAKLYGERLADALMQPTTAQAVVPMAGLALAVGIVGVVVGRRL